MSGWHFPKFVAMIYIQVCETKTDNVCGEVPSTSCSLVGFAECELITETSFYNETEVIMDGVYIPWECKNITKNVGE